MRVLIVAKTKIGASTCVGGLDANGNSVRLLESDGSYPAPNVYAIGQIWDIKYVPAANTKPPHNNEDVLVSSCTQQGVQPNLAAHLRSRLAPWTGGITSLYEGKLGFTGQGRGYIEEPDIPSRSTWFWIPDKDLTLINHNGKPYYQYDSYEMSYVGVAPVIATIPKGTLVRVSLARWWRPPTTPNFQERCYLQLSGWYV
jgi:hypothetical protein